jgi:hypothetical protein
MEDMSMKPVRSAEVVQLRRELARLLWRLRGIRQELAGSAAATRVDLALSDVGTIRALVVDCGARLPEAVVVAHR